MKKRIVSALLVMVMLFSCLPASVFAATDTAAYTNPTVAVVDNIGAAGSTVNVDVKIVNNPGVAGAKITVAYHEDLTLVAASSGAAFKALDYTRPGVFTSPCNFTWDSENTEATGDGVILTLTFQISEDAVANEKLDINLSYRYGDFYNSDLDSIAFEMVSGCVQVLDYVPGDVNSDGIVNGKDVTLARRINAGGYNITGRIEAANVNGDTVINGKDITLIRRYHAGGYGVILMPSPVLCDHEMAYTEAKAPACEAEGNVAYWYCGKCDGYYTDSEGATQISADALKLNATGHTEVIDPAVAPTYTNSGLTEGSHCSTCNKLFVAQEVLPPLKGFAITYTIFGTDTYLAQQIIENPNPYEYNPEQDTFPIKDLTAPAGYEFLGWYDAPQSVGGNRVTEIPKGSTGDKALYAHWKEETYDVTYKLYQTPLGAITEERYLHYSVSKGLKNLPNPEIHNYVFLGWYLDDGTEVKEIAVGTTGDITLNAYWTSKRNIAKSVGTLKDPIIIEDSDEGVFYFTYELGTIENVPLSDAIWTIQSVSGLAQQKSETVSTTISEEMAKEIADTISNSTVDSATWTLSKDWNDVTSVSEEWAKEQGMSVETANEVTKTESGTYSFTSGTGGCNTTTTTDGTTTVDYKSQNYTHGNSAEFNAKVSAQYSAEMGASVGIDGIATVDASYKYQIGGEIGGGYEQRQETNEHTGTDTTKVNSTVTEGSTSWNKSSTSSKTQAASQSESVSKALSEIISSTTGYGKSYSTGGENSESQAFSSTDSKSVSTSSALTYFNSETKTVTTTYSTDGKSEGCYRLVVAGIVHVFGVVGYDVATQSYFTYTFNVLDDKTYEFLDYSPSLQFNDYQNGALPFEVPYFVHEYVTSKTVVTDGLAYTTNSTTGTAMVTDFEIKQINVGTEEEPKWEYANADVVIPSYIASGGNAYKVVGITDTAFAGKPIRAVVFSDYITEIPANAFKDCTELRQISGRFVSIDDNAFSGCTNLENFIISPRTTTIGENAFVGVDSLKMNALYASYAPENAAAATQTVIQSAVSSGAQNVAINISKITANTVLTLEVPEISSFELIGDKKTTYTDLKISSLADSTKLRNITTTNCTRIPLEIKNGSLTLDTVNITAPSFVLLLAEDGAKISLLRDSRLVSEGGNAIVAKNLKIESLKDENVWGSLNIDGNFYYCGTEPNSSYMTITNGTKIPLSEEEFASYIQGCFTVTFDPNGGSVDQVDMTAFVGQPLGTLPVPTRIGHNFVGWFDQNGTQVTQTSAFATVTDVTLTAKWSAMAYTVSWNTDAGYTITVKRTSSPYAGADAGVLSNGATIYHGDVLNITYGANTGYNLGSKGQTEIHVTGDVTSAHIYASANVNSYTATWSVPTGASITVKRTSSPLKGAACTTLSSGAAIYYGDVLSITYTASTGYSLSGQGKTSITVTGNVTGSDIKVTASLLDITYNIVYKSSNGTNLGSTTATYKYGTTNTISAPAKSGYNTPGSQSVKWDSTSAKTITFTYVPTYVEPTQWVTSGNWWYYNSSTQINYSTSIEYRNRTASSVEVRVHWTNTISNGRYGYAQSYDASIGGVATGTVGITSNSTWDTAQTGNRSVTATSGWVTVPLNTTNQTTVSVSGGWWDVCGRSGGWSGSFIVPAF